VTNANNTNYDITFTEGTLTIGRKTLTATASASNKVYDGNTTASVTLTFTGLVGDETLGQTVGATFADKNVATGKTVTVNSITLANGDNGGLAANYSIATGQTTTANITAKALTINSELTSATKEYDGTTTAAVTSSGLVGLVAGEDVTATGGGNYDNANVGTGKAITISYTLQDGETAGLASNYTIAEQTTNSGVITAKALTYTVSASNKTYDGTTAATATVSLSGFVGEETLAVSANSATFADKNVATGKTVTVNSITLANGDNGGLAANYSIATGGTTTANITAKSLSISDLTASNKVYDGTTTATISSYGTLSGAIAGDTVSLDTTNADPNFNNKNAGTGKTVTVASLALTGDDSENYSISDQSTTAAITKKTLTATAAASDKVYDGSTTATVELTLTGVIVGETVSETNSSTFDSKNVGTDRTVTVNSITLAGDDSANYQISAGQTTTASITKKTLTASLTGTASKTYNGNTSATLTSDNYSISGFVGDEGATIAQTSGTYDTKNVGTSKTVTASVSADNYTANDGTSLDNYTLDTGSVTGSIGTIVKKNVTLTAPAITKTYDGTVAHTPTDANLSDLSSQLVDGDTVTTATIAFSNKNVGTGKTVTLSSVSIDDGNSGGNYSVTLTNSSSGAITKAPLTVTAIDDAKFITEADPTFTFVYNGFVNGETASALATAGEFTVGSVTRSNSDTNAAGTYTGVLVPAGFSADNYNITVANGNFTIVPADQLLFRITPTSNVTYGSSPVYSNTSGTHTYTAKYLDSANNEIVNLTANAAVTGNTTLINDRAGTSAIFDINAKDGTLSTSNNLVVGGYNLEATNTSISGSNFTSLIVVGSLTVDPVHIDVTNNSHISVTSISKTYDGTATISSVPITFDTDNSIIQAGDLVTISGTGSYNNRHVGTSKGVTVDVSLSGADSRNYALIDGDGNANTRITGNVGTITQLSSVTWTGATTGGEWSNAANWDGGAIPDQSNVATAIIPVGYSVIYNSDIVGQISNTTIQNNGVVEFNGSNAFELDSVVTGTGNLKHSGDGILTISGDNTYSGNLNITNKEVSLTHNNALGTGNSIVSNSGSLSIGSGVTLPSLTVTGAITIKTDVTTTGAQTYNNDVTIYSDSTLETIDYDNFAQTGEDGEITKTTLSLGDDDYVSRDWKIFSTSNANISFGGKLKASSGSKANKTSLLIKTCNTDTCTGGEVTFDNKVGYEFIDTDMSSSDSDRADAGQYADLIGINRDNFYRLDVKAKTININANIMTWEEQIYRSPVLVGSNDDSLVKYAVSIDPAVTFLSTVGDSSDDGTHTLVVRAIELPDGSVDPKINFNINNIGNLAKFDPYAFTLSSGDDLSSLNFGSLGSGIYSGSTAGYTPTGGLRDNAYIITYSAPTVSSSSSSSSSSSRLVDILKSLTEAGNNGSILDFFKNLGKTGGENRVFVKSIEIITGDEARKGNSEVPRTNKNQQENFKRFNNQGSAECSEEPKLQTECKNQ